MQNKNLKKAIDEIEYLTGDAAARRMAQLRLKAKMDENTAFSHGEERGRKKGRLEGRAETKIEYAKKCWKKI